MAGVGSDDQSELPRRLLQRQLNTTKAGHDVILLKVPAELAPKSWEQQGDAGSKESLVRMTVTWDLLNPQALPKHSLQLPGKDGELSPTKYELNSVKDFGANMLVFSEAADGKLAAEGTVTRKFVMQRDIDLTDLNKYGKLNRERQSQASGRRTVQVLKDGQHGTHMGPRPASGASGGEGLKSSQQAAREQREKRWRAPLSHVEASVFKLFEENPYWQFKNLLKETNQPVNYLKNILDNLCTCNKSGIHQGTYELKPEYKPRSGEDAPAATSG